MQRLSHTIEGNGPALLLIHGMGSAKTAWKPVQKELSNYFTVITVDLPGHGETPYQTGMAMDPNNLARYAVRQMNE